MVAAEATKAGRPRTMNCPDCGAAMEPVAARNYFRCGHCGNCQFPEETGDGVHVTGAPVDMSCPVCQKPLQAADLESETVASWDRSRGCTSCMILFRTFYWYRTPR